MRAAIIKVLAGLFYVAIAFLSPVPSGLSIDSGCGHRTGFLICSGSTRSLLIPTNGAWIRQALSCWCWLCWLLPGA